MSGDGAGDDGGASGDGPDHRRPDDGPGDAGFDEWIAALGAGEGYFLRCPNGHGSLPPRRVCPECADPDLEEEPLAATGEVETFTVVHVAAPQFADDVPYVTAVASFGPVRLTGVVRGADPDDVAVGDAVVPDAGRTETEGEPVVVLRPA